MKRFVNYAVVALMFFVLSACERPNPTPNNILGMWYEQAEGATIKSLLFQEDGTLLFRWSPDPTSQIIIDWGGEYNILHYVLDNEKVVISVSSDTEEVEFTYQTPYSISNNILTIDSFVYEGKVFNGFKLYHGNEVTLVEIDTNNAEQLKTIFSTDNELLADCIGFQVKTINSAEELQSICPPNQIVPEIDFSKQCIVYSLVRLSSSGDEILNSALLCNNQNHSYEYFVDIQQCIECYTDIKDVFVYGVYDVAPSEMIYINPIIQLIYK